MNLHIKEIKSFLKTTKDLKHLGLKLSLCTTDEYTKAINMDDKNAFTKTISKNDKSLLKQSLPHPYNKKKILPYIDEVFIHYPIGQVIIKNKDINVIVKVNDEINQNTNDHINVIKEHLKENNILVEYHGPSNNSKFTGTLASKNGMTNVVDEIIDVIAKDIDEKCDISDSIKSESITDTSLSDDDYKTLLYSSMLDAEKDMQLIRYLFDNQLSILNIKENKNDILKYIKNTKIRYAISDLKLKTIIGYSLLYNINDETLISLLNSKIEDRLIISKQTPNLNLKIEKI